MADESPALRRHPLPGDVSCTDRWLVVGLHRPARITGWPVVAPATGAAVAWLRVTDGDLRPPVDAGTFLEQRMAERGLAGAAGFLTSAVLSRFALVTRQYGDHQVRAVATVGMGNARRIGDGPGPSGRIGTINILCETSFSLTPGAALEALSLATEARTLAVLEAGIPSTLPGAPQAAATGTGTDSIVIADPLAGAAPTPYCGKHTVFGHLIGSAVLEAVRTGVRRWQTAGGAVHG